MKKAVLFLIAAAASVVLCAQVSAFVPQKIKSMRADSASVLLDIRLDTEPVELSELTRLNARPGSELEVTLAGEGADTDLFLDQNGTPVNAADVTASRMRAAGVALKADVTSGEEVFGDMGLAVRSAGTPAARPVIRISFSGECENLDAVDFSASLCILVGGEEQAGSRLELAGTFGNPEITVDSGDITVSAGSAVLSAAEDIPIISIDAGSGVFVDASMRAGKRYLVTAAAPLDEYDLELIEKGAVEDVIRLKTVGFERSQIKNVKIESGQILQVYDKNGKRLGNTSQKLPYSEKYYIAAKTVIF